MSARATELLCVLAYLFFLPEKGALNIPMKDVSTYHTSFKRL